jgi:hypothetical protein
VLGGGLEPFARRSTEAVDHVVDVLHGFGEIGDHRFVGAEFRDLGELCHDDGLYLLHLFGAFGERLLVARGEQGPTLARKARALCRQLLAGGKARDIAPAQFDHGLAEVA